MTTIPLGEARYRLPEVVTQAEDTHDRIVITRHGQPAAVLIAADDLWALEETLDIPTPSRSPREPPRTCTHSRKKWPRLAWSSFSGNWRKNQSA